jgi:cell division protein FtsL
VFEHILTGLTLSILPVLTASSVNTNGKAYKKIEEEIGRAQRKNPELEFWVLRKQLVKKLQIERMVITFLVVFIVGMIGSMTGLIDMNKSLEEDPPSGRLP